MTKKEWKAKSEKMKMAILTLILGILIIASTPEVSASHGHEYVVVAWDEEFAGAPGTLLYLYIWSGGILPLDAQKYSDWQWSRVLYHFHNAWGTYVNIEIIGTVTFDSRDDGTLEDTLYEAIDETGFRDGIYFGGKRATILMVWTLQDNDNLGGGCLPEERAFIVKYQMPWADDNTILHELTHIWIGDIPPADTEHGECLMSYTETFAMLYNEPLQPDFGFITLSLFVWQNWGYFAYHWCDDCTSIMSNHMSHEYPPPPDPWMEELNPDLTYRILFYIGVVTAMVVIVYLLSKSKRFKKLKIVKDKNSSFNLSMFIMFSVRVGDIFLGIRIRPIVGHPQNIPYNIMSHPLFLLKQKIV